MKEKVFLYATLILALFMGCTASAETVNEAEEFMDVSVQIDQWNDKLVSLLQTVQDEDSQYLLTSVIDFSTIASTVFLDVENSPAPLEGTAGTYKFSAPYQNEGYLETGSRFMEDFNCYFECKTEYTADYLRVEEDVYQQDGTYIGSQKLEIGKKDGQLILLYFDYDPAMNMTGRFAMLPSGNNGNTIFTKTFGRTWDVALNIRQWLAEDQNISWNKTLLYSTN